MSDAPLRSEFEQRRDLAERIVRRGLAHAEEKYLVEPGASLGTWFARIGETISVACRVSLTRIAEERPLADPDVRGEQVGVFADIAAEGIRGSSQVWSQPASPRAHDAMLSKVGLALQPTSAAGWSDVLMAVARCTAALEPVANGLRDGDLPLGGSTDRDRVFVSFFSVVSEAVSVVFALC